MSAPLRVAVAGLGTVGAATVARLRGETDLIAARAGRPVTVTAVSARDRSKDRGVDLGGIAWFDDPAVMAREAEADLVAELIGGSEGPARDAVEKALGAGRHVVTANKALLAHHGAALAATADGAGLALAYEAAVAGGIPVIKALREGLSANRIASLHGILNGTCNYILSNMRETGRSFDDVLAEAQELGYAEADPTFDVDGLDAAHKLAILASVGFGTPVDLDDVFVDGIRHVTSDDIQFAEELGYRIKLLGIARRTGDRLEARVHACMIPHSAQIVNVEGVLNAVQVDGDTVGRTVYEGAGAGAGPTASAVIADIVDVARGRLTPTYGVAADALKALPIMPMADHVGPYYLRLMLVDRPGVIADVTAALRDCDVSVQAMLQRGRDPGEAVPVVLTTHETVESAMRKAVKLIAALDTVTEPPRLIRIEPL